ncbi:hypothetical protein [Tissierella pigra]|nr:hypothetical protein [Tissierella pigra]
MELLPLEVCGIAGTDEKPIMMIGHTYIDYISFDFSISIIYSKR